MSGIEWRFVLILAITGPAVYSLNILGTITNATSATNCTSLPVSVSVANLSVIQQLTPDYVLTNNTIIAGLTSNISINAKLDLIRPMFHSFAAAFNKSYDTPESQKEAEANFMHNTMFIHTTKGNCSTYEIEMNEFGGEAPDHYKNLCGFVPHAKKVFVGKHTFGDAAQLQSRASSRRRTIGRYRDWRRHAGVVSSVKHQGKCGACWAFAAAGALEGHYKLHFNQTIELSPQQLIDCADRQYDNHGCTGGAMANAFEYCIKDDSMALLNRYASYNAQKNRCRWNEMGSPQLEPLQDYFSPTPGDEEELRQVVWSTGPVCVSIDASPRDFMFYKRGIYQNRRCSTNANHAMLVVGFGKDRLTGLDYWLIKNSWGSKWGEKGYMRMVRNRNMCGVATASIYPAFNV